MKRGDQIMQRGTLELTWLQCRTVVLVVLGGILLGLGLLFLFDMFRPARSPTLGMLLIRFWPLTQLLAVAALVAAACVVGFARIIRVNALSSRRQRLALGAALLLVLPEALMVIEGVIYGPLKFTWLIHRVEAARTSEAERVAFLSADRWANVWELNRLRAADRKWWPDRFQGVQAEWLLELEWLELGWGGEPYRAYRVVLDEKNLEIFR